MSPVDPTQDGPTQPREPLDTVDFAEPAARAGARRGAVTAAVSVLGLVVAFALGTALARGGDGTDALGPAAATSSASPSDDADDPDEEGKADDGSRPGPGVERRHGRGGFGPMLGLGPAGHALHGTFVVEDPDGGYRTVVTQRGEVTAVSATSLTVKSTDGFTQTYRLDEDTTDLLGGPEGVGDLSKGDEVGVSGEKSGGVTRATHVVDLSRVGGMLRHGFKDRAVPGAPSPSATTEGSSTGI